MTATPRRAVIYARFSTDLQNERSIDDQVALCRAYTEREGFEVTRVYADRGKSGASIFGRDGLISLLADARHAAFEAVVVEHADRLARSMRDNGELFERLTFLDVAILAVNSACSAWSGSCSARRAPARCGAALPASSAPAATPAADPTATASSRASRASSSSIPRKRPSCSASSSGSRGAPRRARSPAS